MHDWQLDKFLQDLCAWPSLQLAPWPESAPPLTLINAGLLRDTTLALSVLLPSSAKVPETKLPSSLTHLEISGGSTFKGDLFGMVPPSVETLSIDVQREFWIPPQTLNCNFAPLALLAQLTSLCLAVATFNSEKMLLLPQSLRSLNIYIQTADLESFGFFPSGLTSLVVKYKSIRSNTTGASVTGIRGVPMNPKLDPVDFPSMRDSFVAKLPRSLQEISPMLLDLVHPKDWDVLPRGIRFAGEQIPRTSSLLVSLDGAPYLANLPNHIDSIFLCLESCTMAMAASLPRFLTSLRLKLFAPSNLTKREIVEALDGIYENNKSVLEALSQRCPLLKVLELELDETFDLALLSHLTTPITSLSLLAEFRLHEDVLKVSILPKREIVEAQECVGSLTSLTLNNDALGLYSDVIPALLTSCDALKKLNVFSYGTPRNTFLTEWLDCLSPSLVSFTTSIDVIDANTFKTIPRTVKDLNLTGTKNSQWMWSDLLFLPRNIRSVQLPLPCPSYDDGESGDFIDGDDDDEEATFRNRQLDEMASCFKHAKFSIHKDTTVMYSNLRPYASLTVLIAAEERVRRSRANLE